jgi:tetratricopeptide (TPR) repeat protein
LKIFGNAVESFFTTANARNRHLRFLLGSLTIVALLFVVYRPVLPGDFVIDDAKLIGSENPLVNGNLTPRSIWFQTDFTLATFGWWLEQMAFGKNPAGYHIVNIALQAVSAILLWRLLARLKIPGAWLAAAVFAIHPVCVNSVARISELKNTLSMPFYLLCFFAYLHYESAALYPAQTEFAANQKFRRNATLWLTLSLVAFVLALLAKTTAVMLPVVLLICAAWQRGRIVLKDLLHTAPFFVLSLGFGLMSVWFQRHQALTNTHEVLQPASFGERLAASAHDVWFYLGKALLPVNLSVIYYRWRVDAETVTAWLPLLLLCAVFILCWRFRRTWGRHVLFGLGCFVVTLFPALGFFDAQFLTMWRVSDHLQYKPLVAIVALAASALALMSPKILFRSAAIAVLLVLSLLTFQRAQVFASDENILRDTLAKNPKAWVAHNDLGIILAKNGDYPGAIREFSLSLQCNPDNLDAHENLGHALAMTGNFSEAEKHFLAALKLEPGDAPAHKAYAEALAMRGRRHDALRHLAAAASLKPEAATHMQLASLLYANGDSRRAVVHLHNALELKPDLTEALNNLAWILATCPDDTVRDGSEAVRCAKKACRQTAFRRAEMMSVLAAAYAEAGRFPEAINTAESATRIATAAGDRRSIAINNRLLANYRAGKPWHEGPMVASSQ